MYQQIFKLHSSLLKSISHPKRLEIIHLLRDQNLNVTEIQQMLGLSQANLSQHLMLLRESNVVRSERQGKEIYYRLSHPNIIKANDLIREALIEIYKDDKRLSKLILSRQNLVPIVIDPICGMRLSSHTAAYTYNQNDKHYYFCARGCLQKFINKAKSI